MSGDYAFTAALDNPRLTDRQCEQAAKTVTRWGLRKWATTDEFHQVMDSLGLQLPEVLRGRL